MMYSKKHVKNVIKFPVTLIIDDRERKPWFSHEDSSSFILKRERLLVGDYTIEGFEDKFVIEKKSGWEEFLVNIAGKRREKFRRALNRLSKIKYAYIVIETSVTQHKIRDALDNAKEKGCRLAMASPFYWITEILTKYRIPILFVDKRCVKYFVETLIKRFLENNA